MLVLTRKEGESIVLKIGEERIIVTLIESGSKRARVGFEAPEHVQIWREELLESNAK